jgi:hypothetical protein
MAAPPPPPRHYILPGDVQGSPLARLLIAHPDAAGAVFAFLDYADATPLRAACVGFRGAVAEHPWALPLPVPYSWWFDHNDRSTFVRTPAGLARWRAAFPAARTLFLAPAFDWPQLRDADVAPAAAWGLAGVQLSYMRALTRVGLAALCGPALTALCLSATPQLSGADVAAVTAQLRRLRTLHLDAIGPLADADLAAWGGVQSLTVVLHDMGGFTWAGVRHLTAVRELTLPLLAHAVNWVGDALRGLAHLTRLSLERPFGSKDAPLPLARVHGPDGLFAPGSLPRALRHVALEGLLLVWPRGVEPDGGAALLRPLAGVPDVSLSDCRGVGDGGLSALAGATQLTMTEWGDVAGEHLAPLGGSLQELTVSGCDGFTGGGLGRLTSLRWLRVVGCEAFPASSM